MNKELDRTSFKGFDVVGVGVGAGKHENYELLKL